MGQEGEPVGHAGDEEPDGSGHNPGEGTLHGRTLALTN